MAGAICNMFAALLFARLLMCQSKKARIMVIEGIIVDVLFLPTTVVLEQERKRMLTTN